MKELRKLALHIVLLVVAAGLAYAKSRPEDESARPLEPGEVELWGGKPEDVKRVSFSGKKKTVTLESAKDATGSWYKGQVEPAANPPPEEEDAGPPSPHKPKPRKVEAATFMSVSVANKLMKGMAPLRAKKAIGEVGEDRAEAFGLHDPQGTLVIEIGDKKHTLIVGAATMGSGDRYVRYQKDNLVYVIDAAMVRDLEGGAGRLSERQQHEWKMADVEFASISAGENKRELKRSGTEGRKFWADVKTEDVNDETAANWLKKLERLRPIKFVEKLPEGASKIVRVDFTGGKQALGHIEVFRVDGEKTEFYVQSEYLRMPANVASTIGEQVQDDLNTVLGLSSPEEQEEKDDKKDARGAPSANPSAAPKAPKSPHGGPPGSPHGKGDGPGR